MPDLLTLQSNLKLLKFQDFSEQDPYVLKSITSTEVFQKRNSIDIQFEKRADDLQRMFKLLKDRPGLKFIAKLGVLSVLEYEDKPLRVAGKVLKNVAATLAGILAQSSLNGTGFHFSVDQTTGNLYIKTPSSFKKSKTIVNDNKVDRLTGDIRQGLPLSFKSVFNKLKSEFSKPETPPAFSNIPGAGFGLSLQLPTSLIRNLQSEDKLRKNLNTNLNYNGQAGTSPEVPKNIIRDNPVRLQGDVRNPTYFTETLESAERDLIQNSKIFNNETNDFGGRPSQFSTYVDPSPVTPTAVNKLNSYKDKPVTETGDRSLSKIKELINRPFPNNYLTGDVHTFGVPRSNKRTIRYSGTVQGSDGINSKNVISTEYGKSDQQGDFIPFEFGIYEPGSGKVDRLYFRAYLEDFNDTYTGEWNPTKYVGRAEAVYVYNGFKREIGLGFKIAASSKVELLPIYKKLNFLVGSTAPSYSSTFMRGIFVRLTVGDYFSDVPGFFTSISTGWQTNYPWDIARGTAGIEDIIDKDSSYLPHVLDIKTNFTPLHSFVPAYRQPFIGQENILGDLRVQKIPEGVVEVDPLVEESFNGEDRSKRNSDKSNSDVAFFNRPTLTSEQIAKKNAEESLKKILNPFDFDVEAYRKARKGK